MCHKHYLPTTHSIRYKTFLFGEKWVGVGQPCLPAGYATGFNAYH